MVNTGESREGHRKVGEIGVTGKPILISDCAADSEWIGQPEWARSEGSVRSQDTR